MSRPDLLLTLSPAVPHFRRFASDSRLTGLRMNMSMQSPDQVEKELGLIGPGCVVPLYFDVKGRQLRVMEALPNDSYLDLRMNHPIEVNTPTVVLLKAGEDRGLLGEILDDGYRLLFSGNPQYRVKPGESIHIRDKSLRIKGPLFSNVELDKIERAKKAGVRRWFLSYVEETRDIDQFRELVGDDEVLLKIESQRGIEFVAQHFQKTDNTRLVAACGDLFVEVERPHDILNAVRTIIQADPHAVVGSRMLLSVVHDPVPSYADLAQLAWLYEIGYRTFMLCDELCLKEASLATAVNVFQAFASDYPETKAPPVPSNPRGILERLRTSLGR